MRRYDQRDLNGELERFCARVYQRPASVVQRIERIRRNDGIGQSAHRPSIGTGSSRSGKHVTTTCADRLGYNFICMSGYRIGECLPIHRVHLLRRSASLPFQHLWQTA